MNYDPGYEPKHRIQWVAFALIIGGITTALLVFGIGPFSPLRKETAAWHNPGAFGTQGGMTRAPTPTLINIRMTKVSGVIQSLRSVSRLETQEARIVVDVSYERGPLLNLGLFWVGGETGTLHLEGDVIGRIDLGKMVVSSDLRSGDIQVSDDGESLVILLPTPELAPPILDLNASHIGEHDLGMFAKADPHAWEQAQRYGAAQIALQACQGDLLNKTGDAAMRQVTALLGGRFREVQITLRPSTTTCEAHE